MDDTLFTPVFMPDRYQDRVQRSAVLYRLQPRPHNADQVSTTTIGLVGAWRYRLHSLMDVGWEPAGDRASPKVKATKAAFMRNCCPTFVYCTPRTVPCCMRYLCPFCYGRSVGEVFKRVDKAFPNPRQPTPAKIKPHDDTPLRRIQIEDPEPKASVQFPYHLIERRVIHLLPFVPEDNFKKYTEFTWLLDSLTKIIGARRNRIRRYAPTGAYSHLTVEPADDGWLINLNEMYMVPADYDQSKITKPPGSVVRRYTRPTRKVLHNSVARVCAYPVGMFFGDAQLAMTVLHARHNRKMSASFGRLRRLTDE